MNNYTLYEKRGRRYIPVQQYDSKIMDSFTKGFTMVHVEPGVSSYRYNIDPAIPEVLAAVKLLQDAMAKAMRDKSRWTPNRPLTKKQKALYDAYAESMGNDIYLLQSASAYDVVEAGTKILMDYFKAQKSSVSEAE